MTDDAREADCAHPEMYLTDLGYVIELVHDQHCPEWCR